MCLFCLRPRLRWAIYGSLMLSPALIFYIWDVLWPRRCLSVPLCSFPAPLISTLLSPRRCSSSPVLLCETFEHWHWVRKKIRHAGSVSLSLNRVKDRGYPYKLMTRQNCYFLFNSNMHLIAVLMPPILMLISSICPVFEQKHHYCCISSKNVKLLVVQAFVVSVFQHFSLNIFVIWTVAETKQIM